MLLAKLLFLRPVNCKFQPTNEKIFSRAYIAFGFCPRF